MQNVTIGLLSKQRGNFRIQAKFAGTDHVVDNTSQEVEHHRRSLAEAGYRVQVIPWCSDILHDLSSRNIDLVFNVSSLVEAAVLEELEVRMWDPTRSPSP